MLQSPVQHQRHSWHPGGVGSFGSEIRGKVEKSSARQEQKTASPARSAQKNSPIMGAVDQGPAQPHSLRECPAEVSAGLVGEIVVQHLQDFDSRPSLPGSPCWTEDMNPGGQPCGDLDEDMMWEFNRDIGQYAWDESCLRECIERKLRTHWEYEAWLDPETTWESESQRTPCIWQYSADTSTIFVHENDTRPSLPGSPCWTEDMNPGGQPCGDLDEDMMWEFNRDIGQYAWDESCLRECIERKLRTHWEYETWLDQGTPKIR